MHLRHSRRTALPGRRRSGRIFPVLLLLPGFLLPVVDALPSPAAEAIGDTITVIQRPLLNVPAFALAGGTFPVYCRASAGTSDWAADLDRNGRSVAIPVLQAIHGPSPAAWRLTVSVPEDTPEGLYDLRVAAEGLSDVTRHSVKVLSRYRTDYYFVHITDTHLPTGCSYSTDPECAEADTSSISDLRAVIDDVNILNPEFVLLTGDVVNDGELEEYDGCRYYSKAQRLLGELAVPVFVTCGNHDVGGWKDTPPSDGTARRNWWRFFGWKPPDDAPAGTARTQDYSFDYGPVHYAGMEAYINYDGWRSEAYGGQSFTPAQMEWLAADLGAASQSVSRVLFYHDDFSHQLDLRRLGVTMALWGHIHRSTGSLSESPYNISTGCTTNGARTYRIVRVHDGVLTPLPAVDAGASGEKVRALFSPANDGTHASLSALLINDLPVRFENARVRFLLPRGVGRIEVRGGTLAGTEDTATALACEVAVDLMPAATQSVDVTGLEENGPAPALSLDAGVPNPFAGSTLFRYDVPEPGRVTVAVFAPGGRRVATLIDETLPAGPGAVLWDGTDASGRRVPPGTYFCRLGTSRGSRSERISLVR